MIDQPAYMPGLIQSDAAERPADSLEQLQFKASASLGHLVTFHCDHPAEQSILC